MTTQGTTFITAECFLDRYAHAVPGATFSYATGDMTYTKQWNADAMALCKLVTKFTEAKKIIPTMKRRFDINLSHGGLGFEYFATKCTEGKLK